MQEKLTLVNIPPNVMFYDDLFKYVRSPISFRLRRPSDVKQFFVKQDV